MVSATFLVAMIYFYNRTSSSEVVARYKSLLTPELQQKYAKITSERRKISYQGYGWGLVLSLLLLFYLKRKKPFVSITPTICMVVAVAFVVNYFYYMLHPKSDWMLNHMETKEEVRIWLEMYREMQYHYHMGFVIGIIAIGVFAFAFRCSS
jgi:uncharacterized membrane protein YkgB